MTVTSPHARHHCIGTARAVLLFLVKEVFVFEGYVCSWDSRQTSTCNKTTTIRSGLHETNNPLLCTMGGHSWRAGNDFYMFGHLHDMALFILMLCLILIKYYYLFV